MSKVKFGNSEVNQNQEIVERKWGKSWKFGEDRRFYLYEKLLDYLPKFVVRNTICKALLKAIAIEFTLWQNEVKKLPEYFRSGFPGFKYANEDLQLHISENATKEELQSAVMNSFQIHRERGTTPGILKDIKRLTNDKHATIQFYPYSQCGWIIGETFPEYNAAGRIGKDTNVRIGLDNMLDVVFCNHSLKKDDEIIRIIRDEFIPLMINVRVFVNRPHVIAFGEPISLNSPHRIKWGTFKFGQTAGGCGGGVTEIPAFLEPIIIE